MAGFLTHVISHCVFPGKISTSDIHPTTLIVYTTKHLQQRALLPVFTVFPSFKAQTAIFK